MATATQQAPRSWRTAVTLAVATLGFGLHLRAWILLGPHLHRRFHVGPGEYVLLMGLPLLVDSSNAASLWPRLHGRGVRTASIAE